MYSITSFIMLTIYWVHEPIMYESCYGTGTTWEARVQNRVKGLNTRAPPGRIWVERWSLLHFLTGLHALLLVSYHTYCIPQPAYYIRIMLPPILLHSHTPFLLPLYSPSLTHSFPPSSFLSILLHSPTPFLLPPSSLFSFTHPLLPSFLLPFLPPPSRVLACMLHQNNARY